MDISEIKNLLIRRLELNNVYINEDDGKHYWIIVIGDCFLNINMLQRQKMVYSVLMQYILDGYIHSVFIQSFTVIEWEEACKLNLQ
ncbi:BolA/IbaG family iron-sulfur metabolism protein [Blochmannia endosymbiont of Polyrhachis (Hedomyrma) turneri]|uniref:BolA/IbaG family iron-sulfur metabolism protein n=1 Tax=Blochmannia endosymbiont of Polyrhachis (Hedomyrma) turneri TaxID=1505596 RepID=UPI00061A8798|nr:BolA/IbaG family iron-sulfur metabolism protein [Blochmannia endosymbiont of Polyrhachis (Hedomyrma) turneri]AKC59638.1 putative DNA-binding transcriptional regulator [Blochmannia endosymbiont of Polyrhachis (Hedomyrma) turneri]